jgi:hypothetical protein
MLGEALEKFDYWQRIAEYMHRADWRLEDLSIGGPENHPRFSPNAQYLRDYVERGCRAYMMDEDDWTSSWSGLGFLVFVVANNNGEKHLSIKWMGDPVEWAMEMGAM